MSDGRRLMFVGIGAILLAALASHLVAGSLGLQTVAASGHKHFGEAHGPALALISGSSLSYDGVDWREVAGVQELSIESWPVPGSSPAEWEQLQRRSPHATTTFVGVSLYDLNESWLCDFRADIVPFSQTISDLWHSEAESAFARRLASWYAMAWTRRVFPTAGRADRVIFGARDKLVELVGITGKAEDDARLRLAADYTSHDRISDWPKDRLMRRLASMQSLQGTPAFSGPKHLALCRLLAQARRQGGVIVVVLPVSPPYAAALLDAAALARFEESLEAAMRAVPEAHWVRLDRIPTLHSPDYFYDLVHLNMQGRRIATDALLSTIRDRRGHP